MNTAQLNARYAQAWKEHVEASIIPALARNTKTEVKFSECRNMRAQLHVWDVKSAFEVIRSLGYTDWCATEVAYPDRIDIVCLDGWRLAVNPDYVPLSQLKRTADYVPC